MLNTVLPSISVAMISLNDEALIADCLTSIRKQNYPQSLVDIVIVDGGSVDNTCDIALKFKAQVIHRPDLVDRPDERVAIALNNSDSDLVLTFSADNRFQEVDVLEKMVTALDDDSCVAVETLRYGFNSVDPIFSRYCALIGGADPIAVGLKKADRGPHDQQGWHGYGKSFTRGDCIYVDFPMDLQKIPTLGANGCLIRRKYLKNNPYLSQALHIDMLAYVIMQGNNRVAFIANRHVIHFLNISLIKFLNRRILYALMYGELNKERFYTIYNRRDWKRLAFLCLANTTLIVPLIRAIRGYIKEPDVAWFLHPIVSVAFTFSYGFMVLRSLFQKTISKLN